MKIVTLALVAATTFLFAGTITVTKEERCLVRHIKVYEHPAWIAKAQTAEKKEVYFSSPKSMFEFYFQPDKWSELNTPTPDDILSMTVTDFKTLEAINARTAYYIYGSNVTSPAGDDLVAFGDLKEAEAFTKKHNGKRILRFSEIKNSLIRLINGRI